MFFFEKGEKKVDIDLILEYKRTGKEEYKNKAITSADKKIKTIVTELCKRNKMMEIKEDMIQEAYITLIKKMEKVDPKRPKKEIRSYLEASIWGEVKSKIQKERRRTGVEVKKDEISETSEVSEMDYFSKIERYEILKTISNLKIKDYQKEIFLDYFENNLTRKELEKKYKKRRSQIDYYLDHVKKSIQKTLKIEK